MSVAPLLDDQLLHWKVQVLARDVVYVKGILEASEGLGTVFAERGGDLTIAAPKSRRREIESLLSDLASELGALVQKRD